MNRISTYLCFLIFLACSRSNINSEQRHISNNKGNMPEKNTFSLSPGLLKKVSGEIEVQIIDFSEDEHEEPIIKYWVKEQKSKKRFQIKFSGKPNFDLKTGDKIRAKGLLKNNLLHVSAAGDSDSGSESQINDLEVIQKAEQNAAEAQNVIVVMGNLRDAPLSCTPDQVSNIMFSDPNGHSIDKYYQDVSGEHGISFYGTVHGIYDLDIAVADDNCSYNTRKALKSAAIADNVDFSQADKIVYVLPKACPGIGLGTIGGNPGWSQITKCETPDIYAHELGHNLGMHHASLVNSDGTYSEYADRSDIMGYSVLGLRGLNSIHKEQMGWISSSNINAVSTGTYEIAPLESFNIASPQILKVAKPGTDDFYYLSYRQAIGFDAIFLESQYIGKISIHSHHPQNSKSLLHKVLTDGETFTDTEHEISIRQISKSFEGVTVQVQVGTQCIKSNPSLSIAPLEQTTVPGGTLEYQISVTNNDTSACTSSDFDINLNSQNTHLSLSAVPLQMTLSPKETKSAVVSVSSNTEISSSRHEVSVQAANTNGNYATTKDLIYAIRTPQCIPANPSLILEKTSLSGAPGQTLNYRIRATNNDNIDCKSTSFNLSSTIPTNWTETLSEDLLLLSPGQSKTADFALTSSHLEDANSFPFTIDMIDATNTEHGNSVTGHYHVVIPDTTPPSAPSNLKATYSKSQKKLILTWTASPEDDVTGYNIWRNDKMIGQVTGSRFEDSSVRKNTAYIYIVEAHDSSGNVSLPSNEASYTLERGGGKKKR